MEATFMLISLVIVMLVGSFLAGSIPLFFSFSESKLKKVTVFGAGLLVGTALAVIIPEGVRSLLSQGHGHTHEPVEGSGHEESSSDPLSVIGVVLVLGFIFMLLVDQISQSRNENVSPSERNVTATVGLVVHAAADGVALGAAATTSHAEVEIIVFLAIMLHKAPAAFGLVTYLLHAQIDRKRIRNHLLVFSLSAPVATLLTYFFIGQDQKQTLSSLNATGIAMLFSAGTFLYVATVHVLAELTHAPPPSPSYQRLQNMEGGKASSTQGSAPSQALKTSELACLVIGCLMPLLLTVGHHH